MVARPRAAVGPKPIGRDGLERGAPAFSATRRSRGEPRPKGSSRRRAEVGPTWRRPASAEESQDLSDRVDPLRRRASSRSRAAARKGEDVLDPAGRRVVARLFGEVEARRCPLPSRRTMRGKTDSARLTVVEREASSRAKRARDGLEELRVARVVEESEAVAEAERRVEFARPGQIAHLGVPVADRRARGGSRGVPRGREGVAPRCRPRHRAAARRPGPRVRRPSRRTARRARARPGRSARCFQRKAASSCRRVGRDRRRSQNSTARPSKKVFHQSTGAFIGASPSPAPPAGRSRDPRSPCTATDRPMRSKPNLS